MNRNYYQNARERCMPFGTNIVTDADIILMQEREIEQYRGRIEELKKALDEAEEKFSQMFESKNDTIRELKKALEESIKKVVRPGDIVKFEYGEGRSVIFKVNNCTVYFGGWEDHNVELCGTRFVTEKDCPNECDNNIR